MLGATDPEFIRPEEVKSAQDSESDDPVIFNAYNYLCMLRDAYGIRVRLELNGSGWLLRGFSFRDTI